jgi:hypothetical protein
MKSFRELRRYNAVVLFLALTTLIVLIDQIIGVVSRFFYHGNTALWSRGSYDFMYNFADPFPAGFNSMLFELWFAETIAFILMPIGLYLLRKRVKVRLFPWILAGIVTLLGLCISLSLSYGEDSISDPFHTHGFVFTQELHYGVRLALSNNPSGPDPMLFSCFPYFLESHLLFLIPLAIGYGLSKGYEIYAVSRV